MIKNYKQYNESLRDLMVGPTKEDVWDSYMNGKLKGFIDSVPESPEDFFNQMKEGISEDSDHKVFSKNDVKLFWQNSWNNKLYISYKYIWSIFENIYGLHYDDIQLLITNLLLEDKKWGGLTPVYVAI